MLSPAEPSQRDYVDPVSDSSRWSAFTPRVGDIVVSTPPKCGTTWAQSILALLISGEPDVDAQISMKSPWIDIKFREISEVMARLEAQDHRRQIKTHTPFDGIPFWKELRYITVYRHPIDVHFSFRKHIANMKQSVGEKAISEDPSESFQSFLEDDGEHANLFSIIDHYRCTLKREPRENILRLHYRDMLGNLDHAVNKIAKHVDIVHPPELLAELVKAATFENMKSNAERFAPSAGQDFWKNDTGFFDSASSNKWEGQLTEADLEAYGALISELLTPPERNWLEWGGGVAC
jgi:aryl sulfotransferase